MLPTQGGSLRHVGKPGWGEKASAKPPLPSLEAKVPLLATSPLWGRATIGHGRSGGLP